MTSDVSKVVVLLGSFYAGGSERAMINFANGMAERGMSVDIIAGPGSSDFHSLVSENINVIELERGMLRSIPFVRNYLKKAKPDVFFSSLLHVNVAAMLAKVFNFGVSTKVVLREATTPSEYAKVLKGWEKLTIRFAQLLFRHADHVIGAGEECRNDSIKFYRLDPKKTSTVYSPFVNKAFFDSAKEPVQHKWFSDGSRVIASMGRVMPVKDFPTLIAALAEVRQNIEVKLLIIGETNRDLEHFKLLQNTIAELNLEDAVDFVGFHKNPFPYLVNSEVYVLSSKFEGLPGALVQAMAVGCKLVATDCKSGPREILCGGDNGKLVPVGDADAMASAIIESLSEEHDRSLGRKWTSDFHESNSISKLIRIFENVAGNSVAGKG